MKLLRYGLVVSACMAILVPVGLQAQFSYTTRNGTITITRYLGPGGAVNIPATISGRPVTSIGDGAFAHNAGITKVTIPDSVTTIGDNAFDCIGANSSLTKVTLGENVISIGDSAFSACTKLTSVNIPQKVTSIGKSAFGFCNSLTAVTIPGSVTNIGDRAFSACFSLPAITVATNNAAYSSVDGVLFNKNQTALIQYPGGKPGNYTIPATVGTIREMALWNCPRLTGLILPRGISTIGVEAFAACNRLSRVTIPASVTRIESGAFNSCVSLTAVYCEGSPPTVEKSAFTGDDKAVIYYLPGAKGWGDTLGGRPTAVWKQ